MPWRRDGHKWWKVMERPQMQWGYLAGGGHPLLLVKTMAIWSKWCWKWEPPHGPAFILTPWPKAHHLSGDRDAQHPGAEPLHTQSLTWKCWTLCKQRLWAVDSLSPFSSALSPHDWRWPGRWQHPRSRWPPELSHRPGNSALARPAHTNWEVSTSPDSARLSGHRQCCRERDPLCILSVKLIGKVKQRPRRPKRKLSWW